MNRKFLWIQILNLIIIGTWDFVEIYCLRQCAPLLGDNKYWNRIKLVAGVPMYINPIKHKIFPAKQVEEIDFHFYKIIHIF